MTKENQFLFYQYAIRQMPKEACALLIVEKGIETLVLCDNVSQEKDQFMIQADDYAKAETRGEIIGVVHSHVFKPAWPSHADKVSCEGSGLRWFICSVPTGVWSDLAPSGFEAPLVGREWSHGVLDCYSLVRDYYRHEMKIDMPDFEREFEWWDKGQNLYCPDNWQKAGFYEVPLTDLKKNDALLMQINAKVINHAGVYLGDDLFLHHLNRRLSSRDVFAGYYRQRTVRVARYGSK